MNRIEKPEILILCYSNGAPLSLELEQAISIESDALLPEAGIVWHYYRFLFYLVRKLKPEFILELGTSYGCSSACMAEGNKDSKIITLNIQNELRSECRLDNVEYLIKDSLEKIELNGKKIDLLFIDTVHDGIYSLKEFDLYKNDMSQNGIILFDDISFSPQMKIFWDDLNPEGWEKIELPVHGKVGFGCLIRKQ